jgi:hypothetical protein
LGLLVSYYEDVIGQQRQTSLCNPLLTAFSLQLNKSLEKCMGSVNTNLIRHRLLMALDDRGKLSCHKVNTA